MNDPQFDPAPPELKPIDAGFGPEPPAKQRGCFFYGCIIALILLVIALICSLAGGYLAYAWYKNLINTYTSTAPAKLPEVKISDEDRKALKERMDAFKKSLDAGDGAELVLTADDLNAMISDDKNFAGTAYVTLKGEEISAQVSIPLDKWPIPLGAGRYFNGSGTFTAKIIEGELFVNLQDIEVNGQKLPDNLKPQFRQENLAKSVNDNPDAYRYIRKFESLKVKDGKIYIKAKARAKDEPVEESEKSKVEDSEKEAAQGEGSAQREARS